jgi:hypothetical protein
MTKEYSKKLTVEQALDYIETHAPELYIPNATEKQIIGKLKEAKTKKFPDGFKFKSLTSKNLSEFITDFNESKEKLIELQFKTVEPVSYQQIIPKPQFEIIESASYIKIPRQKFTTDNPIETFIDYVRGEPLHWTFTPNDFTPEVAAKISEELADFLENEFMNIVNMKNLNSVL